MSQATSYIQTIEALLACVWLDKGQNCRKFTKRKSAPTAELRIQMAILQNDFFKALLDLSMS
jgi:hypothetical protein